MVEKFFSLDGGGGTSDVGKVAGSYTEVRRRRNEQGTVEERNRN